MKICIGAGHGGSDPGSVAGARQEKHDNLRMAVAVGNKLTQRDHLVIQTRTTDIYQGVAKRREIAIQSGCDCYIDIHRNSFGSATANGVEIWSTQANSSYAASILAEISKVGVQSNRGVKIDKNGAFGILRNVPFPAALLEIGFISNAKDNELFDRHFDAYATAIARGIMAHFGLTWKEPVQPEKTPAETATIQMGRFTWPDNEKGAREVLAKINAAGFDAFLVIPENGKETEV